MSKYTELAERLEWLSEHVDRALFPNDDTCDEAAALLREADKAIKTLECRNAVERTDHMNDMVQLGLAQDARIAELEAALREIAEKDWLRGEAQKRARAAQEKK